MTTPTPTNEDIAEVLSEIADLLEGQEANPHRVRSYRNAANTVRRLDGSLVETVKQGDGRALQEMPNIGKSIAGLIEEYVHKGRSSLLDRLEAETSPEDLIARVPGVGRELARRIVAETGVDSLEELEVAAHDGRLAKVSGFGERRVEGVKDALAGILSRSARRRAHDRVEQAAGVAEQEPETAGVATLLDVDAEYRRKAEAGQLKKIAPRRFNPSGEAWLPVLHTERDGWRFSALFSNTARAHDQDKTHDWVVLYFERDGEEEQCTVVTETKGALEGKRVVRGRERECRVYYGVQ